MVDALASGASVLMDVEVRVFSWAPNPHLVCLQLTFCGRDFGVCRFGASFFDSRAIKLLPRLAFTCGLFRG